MEFHFTKQIKIISPSHAEAWAYSAQVVLSLLIRVSACAALYRGTLGGLYFSTISGGSFLVWFNGLG